MRGTNPIRPPGKGDGSTLDVQSIFATIQGEGPYTGWPAVFIRLGGCNLACTFCDTEFESFKAMDLTEIIKSVAVIARRHPNADAAIQIKDSKTGLLRCARNDEADKHIRNLIVITGGEPLRQPIEKLCEALLAESFKVQIETNGTLYRKLPLEVEIVCSPKNTGHGYFPLRTDLLPRVSAFKFIVSAQQKEYTDVADIGQGNTPVYVQPMDEYDDTKNAANLRLAMQLAEQHGYRLSLQIHKIIGVE